MNKSIETSDDEDTIGMTPECKAWYLQQLKIGRAYRMMLLKSGASKSIGATPELKAVPGTKRLTLNSDRTLSPSDLREYRRLESWSYRQPVARVFRVVSVNQPKRFSDEDMELDPTDKDRTWAAVARDDDTDIIPVREGLQVYFAKYDARGNDIGGRIATCRRSVNGTWWLLYADSERRALSNTSGLVFEVLGDK